MVVTPGRASDNSSASYDLPPGEKRPRTESDSSKHLVGYKRVWERDFPWLVDVESDGSVTGMMCNLCERHKTKTNITNLLFGARLHALTFAKIVLDVMRKFSAS